MISNSDFLSVLNELKPNGTSLWTNAFVGDPAQSSGESWSGNRYIHGKSDVDSLVNRNTYFSVAALNLSGSVRRINDNFSRLLVLVADDIDTSTLNGEASYILETSSGKFQTGVFIDPDDPDASNFSLVSSILSAMSISGLVSADISGNNAVRYCRLPVGTNQKSHQLEPFQHVLHTWKPEVQLSLSDACMVFGIDIDNITITKTGESYTGFQDEKLSIAITNILNGAGLHDGINTIASSLIASGTNGGSVTNLLRAIADHSSRKTSKYDEWKARYDDIPRSVSTAESKYKKAPEQPLYEEPRSDSYIYDLDRLKPVEFVIDGFISNKITVIAGPPGVGKTSLLVPLACHAAHLCSPCSELKPTLRRRVVYITEDAEQVERILYGLCKHENIEIPEEGFSYWFTIVNAKRQSGQEIAEMLANIKTEYTITSGPELMGYVVAPLVVLDTSNATIDLDDENSNSEAGKVIAHIKSVMGKMSVWLVAHTSKVASKTDIDQMSARGAGAFEGDANAVAYLLNLEGNRFLVLGKRRFEPEFTDLGFQSHTDKETVTTAWGKEQTVIYRYGIPFKSSYEERENIVSAKAEATKYQCRQKILELLANQITLNMSEIKRQIKMKEDLVGREVHQLVADGILTESKGDRGAKLFTIKNPRPYRKD